MKRRLALYVIIAFLLATKITSAQTSNHFSARTITPPETTQNSETSQPGSSLSGRSMGTTIAALGAILLLFFGLVQVWRKFAPGASQSLPDAAWQVLGTAPIDQKHQLTIVRIGSRLLVLGQSDQGLQTLSEITHGEEVAQLMMMCQTQSESADQASFGDLLNKFRSRNDTRPISSTEEVKRA